MDWVRENWEKLAFRLIGLIVLGFSGYQLWLSDEAAFATLFAVAFFCFFYANISRFKKFKGLGFEAEFWEDKQQEAADLIDRLKAIVGIYSKEMILSKAMMGRFSSGNRWPEVWSLFDTVSAQHNKLGAKIDFAPAKRELDDLFLFDLLMPAYREVQKTLQAAQTRVREKIHAEFGSPVKDVKGHSERHQQLWSIKFDLVEEPIVFAKKRVLAKELLRCHQEAATKLKSLFGIDSELPLETKTQLERFAILESQKELQITDDLIAMSANEKL